jgi:uncharacterized protein involved in exopolysaccharide biosynthesis
MEEEIDLRPYFDALIRQWRTIAIVAGAAVVCAVLLAVVLPRSYTASGDVLILPSRTQLTFDPRFVTNNNTLGTDIASRRQALLALAGSQALEAAVRPQLPPEVVGEEYKPGALAGRIKVDSEGDLLHLEASGADAESAQALADTWAQTYVRTVNDLYGANITLIQQLETQQADAQKRYDDAERELETFIGESSIVRVGDQISMTVELLDASRAGTQQLYQQYLTQTRELEAALQDAETLREQVAAGQSEGLANSLAALALRARITGDASLPIDLRFDNPGELAQGNSASLADLDTLIAVLSQRRDAVLAQSQQLAETIEHGTGSGLSPEARATYVNRLSELNREYEQQQAQMKLLEQRRDLALESLVILQRKLDEQRVAAGAPEVQVRFIGTTVTPPRSVLVRAILYGGAAAFAGCFLGILFVLGMAIVRPRLPAKSPPARGERPLDQPTTS